jgi:long-chain acyl-CoA synthetase
VVIGDRRKFLSALLVPDFEAIKPWAEKQGIGTGNNEQLIKEPRVRDQIAKEVEAVNANLASFEKIVAWELLPNEFTLETGELTPTQKVKRRVINQKYGEIIDRLYAEADKHGG